LVDAGMGRVGLGPAGAEQPPHHAVWISQGRRRVGPPEPLEGLLADPLRADRILEDLDLRVDADVAPHRLNGLGHRLVARHVAGGGLDGDLTSLLPRLPLPPPPPPSPSSHTHPTTAPPL